MDASARVQLIPQLFVFQRQDICMIEIYYKPSWVLMYSWFTVEYVPEGAFHSHIFVFFPTFVKEYFMFVFFFQRGRKINRAINHLLSDVNCPIFAQMYACATTRYFMNISRTTGATI